MNIRIIFPGQESDLIKRQQPIAMLQIHHKQFRQSILKELYNVALTRHP